MYSRVIFTRGDLNACVRKSFVGISFQNLPSDQYIRMALLQIWKPVPLEGALLIITINRR